MILVRIEALRHPGCWASDSSANYPDCIMYLYAFNITQIGYKIHMYIMPQDERTNTIIPLILDTIQSHRMYRRINLVTMTETSQPIYSIELRDLGFTRGLIRAVLEDKDARLPPLQRMMVQDGKEVIYAIFRDEKAKDRVESKLRSTIGSELINSIVINENVNIELIYQIIPLFYDGIFPNELTSIFKEILGGLATGSLKFEDTWKRLSKYEDFIKRRRWIIGLAIDAWKAWQAYQ